MLYFLTMRRLLARRAQEKTRGNTFLIFFSTALLILITIFMSTEAIYGEEMWVVQSDFPGGPDAFFVEKANIWYQTLGTTSFITLQLLADSLLVCSSAF